MISISLEVDYLCGPHLAFDLICSTSSNLSVYPGSLTHNYHSILLVKIKIFFGVDFCYYVSPCVMRGVFLHSFSVPVSFKLYYTFFSNMLTSFPFYLQKRQPIFWFKKYIQTSPYNLLSVILTRNKEVEIGR